ncbi:MAG: class I mannose-6-phosphate isomerase [Phycisphaeraceae bacterium]|nr:class I mannose-6-phosphate isomerase [Phycisphaeraceae bacterium]
MSRPYPLMFEPMYFEKVWGGRALGRLGKSIPAGKAIGESWEVADLSVTSASGAGGGSARSVIANGPMKGATLHDALEVWEDGLLGRTPATREGNFPLLVKFLDARENLSVQVHPSAAYAESNSGAFLKTESWYILDAEPGAVIYKGVKRGVTREVYARHIADGSVVDDMVAIPAVVGECHNLPSGTVHALGAGVLVAEVQTPSDTTFRVFDWGRKGRELHVDEALACIDFGPAPAATRYSPGEGFSRLVTTEYFTIDEARPAEGSGLGAGEEGVCSVLTVLAGSCDLVSRGGGFEAITAVAGMTLMIPAGIAGTAEVVSRGKGTTLLRASLV